jgi:Ran GTPase-activating protein (RanGAP) involved in mRNA processing and transport
MSDADSDADPVSDSSGIHVDVAVVGGDEVLISSAVRDVCDQLRANDPRLLNPHDSVFELIDYISDDSEAECIAVFQALKENSSVKHIDISMLFEHANYTERCALVAAEYVESSKTLRTLDMSQYRHESSHEVCEMISILLRALSRNTSVTKLIIMNHGGVRFARLAFQQLLTCTQTLQKLQINDCGSEEFNEVQLAAIASGFANNTTLRDLELEGWREVDLTPVLAALQGHPVLQKIRFRQTYFTDISADTPSSSGLAVLLQSQDSKVKEFVFEKVHYSTVGFHRLMQEVGRNTTVTNLAIRNSRLSLENAHLLQAALRQNTALQSLDLASNALGSAGLAEIAPVLHRNTSIKSLDVSNNGLDDIESATVLRELLRRNKKITILCLADNPFGLNAAATRIIVEGVRSNTALQQLDLTNCKLDDRGMSFLANALAIRNASILDLNLHNNQITSVGVRALVDDNVEAVKTLTKLCLAFNYVKSEGANILADALRRNVMPDLTRLDLMYCGIGDDGFVALVSALEKNTTLQIINLKQNQIGDRGLMALAESLPNIKGLQQITIGANASFQSTLSLLMEGFRKNTSLVEVNDDRYQLGEWSQELKFLGQRNRFAPLLKASDRPGASPRIGVWSHALANAATEPDVIFHVLRSKPKLVGSAGGLKKRKRDGE